MVHCKYYKLGLEKNKNTTQLRTHMPKIGIVRVHVMTMGMATFFMCAKIRVGLS